MKIPIQDLVLRPEEVAVTDFLSQLNSLYFQSGWIVMVKGNHIHQFRADYLAEYFLRWMRDKGVTETAYLMEDHLMFLDELAGLIFN